MRSHLCQILQKYIKMDDAIAIAKSQAITKKENKKTITKEESSAVSSGGFSVRGIDMRPAWMVQQGRQESEIATSTSKKRPFEIYENGNNVNYDNSNSNVNADDSDSESSSDSDVEVVQTAILSCGQDIDKVRRCLVSGYFSNAAQLQPNGSYRTLKGQIQVMPHHTSVCGKYSAPPEWVIYHEVVKGAVATMREVTAINPRWLMQLAAHYYNIRENE